MQEAVIDETLEEAGLAHPGVPDDDGLEDVVEVHGRVFVKHPRRGAVYDGVKRAAGGTGCGG